MQSGVVQDFLFRIYPKGRKGLMAVTTLKEMCRLYTIILTSYVDPLMESGQSNSLVRRDALAW